jgi:PAS domain S-box-containing protein
MIPDEPSLRFLADLIPQLVWTARPDGRVDYTNHRWIEYTGLSSEESEGVGFTSVIHPDDRAEAIARWSDCVRLGEPLEMQARLLRGSGDSRWFLVRAAPMRGAGGETTKWFGTCTDIQDQIERQAREQQARADAERERARAEVANRTKDELLAIVSHELRTPLTAMLGWSRMLKEQRVTEERLKKGLDIIERNAKAQAKLIEDILDVSRIITGRIRIESQAVNVASVVEAALETVRPAADAKGVQLVSSFDEGLAPVTGDQDRLQQVAWNLLTNAVKFTPQGGQVHASARRQGDEVVITVRDTGQGISPEFLPYVFDRFRQEEASTTRSHGGLGLGLSIVRHLVELHGGAVRAESEGDGRGATMIVRLPIRAAGSA